MFFCTVLLWLLPPILANKTLVNWDDYEDGNLGLNPVTTFKTTSFQAPLVHFVKESKACHDDDQYIFMTPHSERGSGNEAMILDRRGELVWYTQERGAVLDLRAQKYKGQDFLTYWVGDDDFYGHGAGYYKMLDRNYQLTYTISASNNASGDYHEFTITKDNTALIITYIRESANLTLFNRTDGYIWDCAFQEIGIETNKLLFEWRARDYFNFTDMAVNSWTENTGTDLDPWDWFHMNSVEKDEKGNYLVAARYTNALTYIDGNTGAVLWNLGGKQNNFQDDKSESATRFIDPHMARRIHGGRGITLFDNIAYWSLDDAQKISRGLEIYVNEDTREARVSKEFVHPSKLFGLSEGSMQLLENGNYFIGYGSMPVYAEFSAKGKLLCDAGYSPRNATKELNAQGHLQSYRIYKYPWFGNPDTLPQVHIERDKMYVSWNGITAMRTWLLSGSYDRRWREASSTFIGSYVKYGFETVLDLPDINYPSFQLTALDGEGTVLGQWRIHKDGKVTELASSIHVLKKLHWGWSYRPWLVVMVSWAVILLYSNRRVFCR